MRIQVIGALLLCTTITTAQTIIRGSVLEAAGDHRPIKGATITILSSTTGTVSDTAGHFTLQVNDPAAQINISCIGFKSQRITSSHLPVDIFLETDSATQLNEINITSKYFKQYSLNTVSSALRLQTPLVNLSQNIQEISQEVIRDQAALTINESVSRNVSGVVRQEVGNNLGAFMFMRGGQISALRNGIDLTPIFRGPVPEDAAIIDRVEFIKGPSIFMSNIGDPAGSFNVMTKQPTGSGKKSIDIMGGSYDLFRVAADLDGNLTKNRKLQYRLNVAGMTSTSFMKYDYNKKLLIAPVLKYNLGERTDITAEYTFQALEYDITSPILMSPKGFGTYAKNFTISEKSLPPYHATDHSGILTFNHSFNKNWRFTARGALLQNNREGFYLWVAGVNTADPNVLLRNPKYDIERTQVFSEQAFINGKFYTGAIKHQTLAGIDINQKKLDADNFVTYDTAYYRLNIDHPQYGAQLPGYHTPGGFKNGNTHQTIDYYSIYLLDELEYGKFRLTLSGRYTNIRTHNNVSKVVSSSADGVLTPRLALSYSILPDFTTYVLYDKSIVPQAGVTSNGGTITPQKGRSFEAGLKKNWLNGKWNTTLSVYDIKRTGIVSADPDNSQYKIQVGETGSKGLDVDIMGQIFKNMNVVINYAYNDAKIENDINKALIGTPTPIAIKHIQNTWLNYELPHAISLSLGYQYQGQRSERYATATQHKIPDFFRLDGGAGWKYKKVRVNLLVNNLLNKTLISTSWYRSGLYYWVAQPGLNGRLSIGYTF